ncbi:hypothetical protein [Flavobacterium sp. B17]|uniref:hypothetical protein n=1 Tax=Flavobacterium sp. B17 TaxID=95618 RepID=UPI0003479FB8|nr:hypothetical protein [Flavobacterium sp. B17]
MNHRVLELLKTPKNIQSEDLHLLEEEINSFPYVQNIRALYLYGVHLYDKDNYQRVLSTTAAYTTDKKILYQLINGKIQQKPKVEEPAETGKEKIIPTENPLQLLLKSKASAFPLKREEGADIQELKEDEAVKVQQTADDQKGKESFGVPPVPKPEFKEVFVKGKRNRILFEGEENFLEDKSVETIDLEATLESGSIITQKAEKSEQQQYDETADLHERNTETQEAENFTPETIVEEEKITSETEKEDILNESDLSFHETEPFLADVQVSANQSEENFEKETETFTDQKDLSLNTEETADFTPETIINEDEIASVKEEESVRDNAELSFHGMESFLPEVKIKANNVEEKIPEISQPNFSKHEDEMRRLIEEVERKMKEKAASEKIQKQEEPENIGHDISFAETQSFEVKPAELIAKDETKEIKPEIEQLETKLEDEAPENTPAPEPEVNSAWKPMSFETNLPDALLSKPEEITQPEIEMSLDETVPEQAQNEVHKEALSEIKTSEPSQDKNSENEETSEKQEENNIVEKADTTKEEAPVMNVSFFGSGWSIPQPEKKNEQKESEQINAEEKSAEVSVANTVENKTSGTLDSNVPGFINTWQSWLKIDRSEGVEKEKTEVKNKVIESFIENNPKISQLKEESNFVVREKGDDISHLMTETLANLYFEQKLYTKAIKAFEVLIKKTPGKKEYFEERIREIKDFRTRG